MHGRVRNTHNITRLNFDNCAYKPWCKTMLSCFTLTSMRHQLKSNYISIWHSMMSSVCKASDRQWLSIHYHAPHIMSWYLCERNWNVFIPLLRYRWNAILLFTLRCDILFWSREIIPVVLTTRFVSVVASFPLIYSLDVVIYFVI